jgi:hypothetical protein
LVVHRREGDTWTVLTLGSGESVVVTSLSAELAVDELYQVGLEDS